ncbi:hypothetical protein EDE11_1641 [Methylomonas methanica]|uniref:C2H2-type domain-containing protein n=1 Tax=Methylomonas methanica TaxID=421 RepID=A0ABY2CK90_METMH|nr:hypothetical protein EDE11_1641 [Methylomonas methanica]
MENKQCPACGQLFQSRPQTRHQSYCSAPSCQRQRKKQWQRNKLQNDPDYQDNQRSAQHTWLERNPDYWRQYRESHPKYADRNRALQRNRNRQATGRVIAKMDVSIPDNSLPSGIYQLSRKSDDPIAKMDVWIVEITVHTCVCTDFVKIAKR